MGNESSKAAVRRNADAQYQFLNRGSGIDIGCGPDPVTPNCLKWDIGDGDAQLMEGVNDESFDWVYSSHCLEHLEDPIAALARWWRLLKPGGRMLVVIPDEDLYEQGVWPSIFNRDHKHTFTVEKEGSWSPVSRNVTALIQGLPNRRVHWIRTIDRGYKHSAEIWDRTLGEAEANIELMLEKLPTAQDRGVSSPVRRPATFVHSGKLGDIVYSLPAVRSLGGGVMALYPNRELGLSPEACSMIEPLLLAQPYIDQCGCWSGEEVDYWLDNFRSVDPGTTNLAECHLLAFGLDPRARDTAWLTVPQRAAIQGLPTSVSRSIHRRGVDDFWQALYPLIEGSCHFLGTEEEHAEFESEIGPIPYIRTTDLLQAASFIAGSQLFIGNQSCLLAIAEGLKVPLIQETDRLAPNCVFYRQSAISVDSRWQALLTAVAAGAVAPDILRCLFPGDTFSIVGSKVKTD